MNWLLILGQYAGATAAIIGAATLIIKFIVIKPMQAIDAAIADKIKAQLTEAIDNLQAKMIELTKPIQPNSNGGKSLADIHKRMDNLEAGHKEILEILTTPPKRGRPKSE